MEGILILWSSPLGSYWLICVKKDLTLFNINIFDHLDWVCYFTVTDDICVIKLKFIICLHKLVLMWFIFWVGTEELLSKNHSVKDNFWRLPYMVHSYLCRVKGLLVLMATVLLFYNFDCIWALYKNLGISNDTAIPTAHAKIGFIFWRYSNHPILDQTEGCRGS